jgi:hypothetical protein
MMEILSFAPRPSEEALFELFYRHCASVYGGYIRDVLRGAPPRDIDVVVDEEDAPALVEDLEELGYTVDPKDGGNEDLTKYIHPSLLPVDLLVDREFSHENVYLTPMAIPDVDYNDLYFFWDWQIQRYRLDRWADDFAYAFGAEDIVTRLRQGDKTTYAHPEASAARLKKMRGKGFIVMPDE